MNNEIEINIINNAIKDINIIKNKLSEKEIIDMTVLEQCNIASDVSKVVNNLLYIQLGVVER